MNSIKTENADAVEPMVKLPCELTAENGAKTLLIGEFHEHLEIECPECGDIPEVRPVCVVCQGIGKIKYDVPISWTTIKSIYKKIVEHLAI